MTRGVLPGPPLVFIRFGRAVEVDWRDVIALEIVAITVVFLLTDGMSGESALVILGSTLIGKTISR